MQLKLRLNTYLVIFRHSPYRYAKVDNGFRYTRCTIIEPNPTTWLGNVIGRGVAKCSPKDHFSRRRGREIAFNRAADKAFEGDRLEEAMEAGKVFYTKTYKKKKFNRLTLATVEGIKKDMVKYNNALTQEYTAKVIDWYKKRIKQMELILDQNDKQGDNQ